MKHLYFFINLMVLLLLIHQQIVAQSIEIKGRLLDLKQQGIAFAHISINNGEQGTTSDIDGYFKIRASTEIKTLQFTCIGYKTFIYNVSNYQDLEPLKRFLQIKLEEDTKQIDEITIQAGENPANIIIRRAVKQRNLHNPKRLKSFSYDSYSKFFLTLGAASDTINQSAAKKDSIIAKRFEFFENHYLFLSESVSERKFMAPNYDKEIVTANKVSGFRNPSFAAIATDFQPFAFHKDHIELASVHYLNPLSKGSVDKYFFFIEDSTFTRADTTYIISFVPRSNKNFHGLKGRLYINTNGYALEGVVAESLPQESDLVSIKLRQKYDLVDNHWFPSQLHADIVFKELKIASRPYRAIMRGYLKNISINPDFKLRDFNQNTLEILPSASEKDDIFWQQYRPENLDQIESKTYSVIDSLGDALNFDRIMQFSEAMSFGYVSTGKFDIDVINALRFNEYEGNRFRFGMQTNNLFHSQWQLGGYLAYGTRDGNFKYGLHTNYKFLPRFSGEVGISWQQDVREPSDYQFSFNQVSSLVSGSGYRMLLTSRMDRFKALNTYLRFRPLPQTSIELSLRNEEINPAYDYQFIPNAEQNINFFTNSTFNISFHYAFSERYLKVKQRQVLIGFEYPILGFNYQRGLQGFMNGDFDYERFEAFVEYHHRSKQLGLSKIRLEAGALSGNTPYSLLYNGRGSFARNFPFVANGYFQTMGIYEFLNQRFFNIFFTHNFGRLLYKSPVKWFQPELVIAQNIGYGNLNTPAQHVLLDFNTMERGYYESGIIIDKILRTKIFNVTYFDFGIGGFYRYGPYGKSTFGENFALRLSLGASF